MEKLTEKKSFLSYHSLQPVNVVKIGTEEEFKVETMNDIYLVGSAVDKLADYEDAEEQGLLLRLPCKVGDTVYTVSSYMECCREECKWVEEECDECCDYQRVYFVKETKFQIQMIAVFGKTVFLTKEEAKQALAKMKEV